ncbi:cytochrome c [Salinarimonas ramus]|uniref:Diacylglycerol kinase n=1 Tax=Salinarimonas ramus TaxID=690164 RepID=A0A917QDC8_9HYPH|nr:cytochrome c [Salinarimonas ramus]GGK44847.1 diacylglycerol kinase [Salinarimonas ramus]
MVDALQKAAVVIVAIAIVAVFGFFMLTEPDLQAAGLERVPGGEADLANGEALFWAGGCASCHATPDQDDPLRLGGGLALETDFGTFHVPNLSPSRDGIFGWTTAQFVRAMRGGVSPEGEHYYPSFPYTSYQRMSAGDLRDLHAYLMTLEPVDGVAPAHDLAFPYNIRRGLGLWKLAFLDGEPFAAPEGMDPVLARGAYLVEGPAHCAECHSPRSLLGAIREEARFAGGPNPEGRGFIPNITPHESGIGSWSQGEIVELLTSGFTPEFDVIGGSMGHVVDATSQLAASDREAIAAYLLALPPKPETPRE